MNKPTEFFAVYTRVSDRKQEEGTSPDRQRRLCIEYGEAQGWTLLEGAAVHDTHTGKEYKERVNVNTILDLVDSGKVKHVVFYKVDRMSRDSAVLKEFITEIYASGGDVSIQQKGRTFSKVREAVKETKLEGFLAELDKDRIVELTSDGKFEQFQAGSVIHKLPYGYVSEDSFLPGGRRFKKAVINPAEQAQIVAFLEEFVKTRSIKQAIDFAQENNFKGRSWKKRGVGIQEGLPFSHTTFKDIISKLDIYAGFPFKQYHGQVKDKLTNELVSFESEREFSFPPLISNSLYNRVKEAYSRKSRKVFKEAKPFEGIIYCSVCGAKARIVHKKKKTQKGIYSTFIYGCSRNHQQAALSYRQSGKHSFGECARTVRITQMKEIVLDFLDSASILSDSNKYAEELAITINNLKDLKIGIEDLKEDREKAKKTREKLNKRVGRLYDDEDLPDEQRKFMIAEAYSEIKEIDTNLVVLDDELKDDTKEFLRLSGILTSMGIVVDESLFAELEEVAYPDYINPLEISGGVVDASQVASALLAAPVIPLVVARQSEQAKALLSGVKAQVEAEDWEGVNEALYRLGIRVYVDFSEVLGHGGKAVPVSSTVRIALQDREFTPEKSDTLKGDFQTTSNKGIFQNVRYFQLLMAKHFGYVPPEGAEELAYYPAKRLM